jgi:hypothetical protein
MTLPDDLEEIKEVFWDRSVSEGVLPAITEEMVEEAERSLGVELPRSYVELLRVQNGGYTSSDFEAFPTRQPTSWADDHVPFEQVFGIGRADAEYPERGLLDNAYFLDEWNVPEGLVLLSGDGHYWIALDYRDSGPRREPSVCWFDTEVDEDLELAASFDDFLRGLCSAELFDDEDVDRDRPPEPGSLGAAALSGAIMGLEADLERLRSRECSLANTKAWCVERTSFVPGFLPHAETARLATALRSVDAAEDSDAAAVAIRNVIRELEALIPAWIEAKAPGYALDRVYLAER